MLTSLRTMISNHASKFCRISYVLRSGQSKHYVWDLKMTSSGDLDTLANLADVIERWLSHSANNVPSEITASLRLSVKNSATESGEEQITARAQSLSDEPNRNPSNKL